MNTILIIIQIVIALSILDVWVLRYNKKTKYRGGDAKSIKEEFAVYGLPAWFMFFIGITKVTLAVLLIVGVWIPILTAPAAGILAILMFGAILMHVKIKDSIIKTLPALIMFVLSFTLALLA